jgi:hypothetical protein
VRIVMECKRCLSGYRVYETGQERYCGFCGARLKGLEARLISVNELIYLDSPQNVDVTIEIRNVGVVEAKVDRIEFE